MTNDELLARVEGRRRYPWQRRITHWSQVLTPKELRQLVGYLASQARARTKSGDGR